MQYIHAHVCVVPVLPRIRPKGYSLEAWTINLPCIDYDKVHALQALPDTETREEEKIMGRVHGAMSGSAKGHVKAEKGTVPLGKRLEKSLLYTM